MHILDPIVEHRQVSLNETFTIELQEQSFLHMRWEIDFPPHIELTDKSTVFEGLIENVTLTLISHQEGFDTLVFTYRKQCCDRHVATTRTYHIETVSPITKDRITSE